MREGRPSFTAEAVAAARAVAGVDPVAPSLVSGALAWAARAGRAGAVPATALNVATFGLLDHVEMRTRAIDAAVREGVDAGAAQLVVLGAGLDARAWRMPELAAARVFEVDHPSTQAAKRGRIGARAPLASEVRFVAVDFGRDSLEGALERAGHDAGAPTFWIWEGVTPYLPLDAVRATLAGVSARSARGSRLAVTYASERASTLGPAFVRVALVGFRVLGEPIVGMLSTEAMHRELGLAGWRVVEDTGTAEWSARFGGGKRRLLLVDERLAVAVSDAPPRASRAA